MNQVPQHLNLTYFSPHCLQRFCLLAKLVRKRPVYHQQQHPQVSLQQFQQYLYCYHFCRLFIIFITTLKLMNLWMHRQQHPIILHSLWKQVKLRTYFQESHFVFLSNPQKPPYLIKHKILILQSQHHLLQHQLQMQV